MFDTLTAPGNCLAGSRFCAGAMPAWPIVRRVLCAASTALKAASNPIASPIPVVRLAKGRRAGRICVALNTVIVLSPNH